MPPLEPDKSNQDSPAEMADSCVPPGGSADAGSEAPAFVTLDKRHWVLSDLLRLFLIVLSLTVFGALALVLLPQSAVEGLIGKLQARHSIESPEQIGFLYLGDEIDSNELRVRGVVRNITAMPIERLDAIVRLYAHDRRLLETTVVRMSKETIDPGAIAQFELVYPNRGSEFGSYSVEFKLRQGIVVPYKDMRTAQERSR